ncbi:MAG: S1 RNA-binding domain-containing protein, partial [Acidobacteria bacterium]|nr:S1 RNA-binding domain-containing protein [Acidobacteriota bacterium]
ALGTKQLTADPWTGTTERLQIGERVKGTVTRVTDFGAFVEIVPGVE